MNTNRRRVMLAGAGSLAMMAMPRAQAAVKLEGITLKENIVVHGQKLVLNGAGVRKRGYYKANVVALYLPERLTLPESVYKLDGVRRIELRLLRDFSSSTISRLFVSDFKQCATDAEFKQLIDVVAAIGAVYAEVRSVSAGDVFTIDWVPGVGIVPSQNDKPLTDKPFKSELAYQIYLRMFIGPTVPEGLRNALLGLSKVPYEP